MRMRKGKLVSMIFIGLVLLSGCGNAGAENRAATDGTTDGAADAVPVISLSENTPSGNTKEKNQETMNLEASSVSVDELSSAEYPSDRFDTEDFFWYREHEVTDCMMMPILQNPTDSTVTVEWFTREEGKEHQVCLFESEDAANTKTASRTISARTMPLSRIRGGESEADCNDPKIETTIYKHVAVVDGLPKYHGRQEERIRYRVCSDGLFSEEFTLASVPCSGTPLRILLTSDLQIKDMCAANLQKVYETVGPVDAIFADGDLVDVTDRAYDWFFADNAFFRVMTGTARDRVGEETYYGAPLLQQAPIYTAIGNHDVMGVYDTVTDLSVQFNYPSTREHAAKLWESSKTGDREQFIRDHSYNTISYEEMFELPESEEGGEKYYRTTIGDVELLTLDVSRVWRNPTLGIPGKYSEISGAEEDTSIYGFGDFIFEPVKEGSDQIRFLDQVLSSKQFQNAPIKVAMFHGEAHSLGGNQIPAFTDPVAKSVIDPVTGKQMVIYDYPVENDYINTVIEPRLENSGVNLLFEAHSHLWNRFRTEGGMNVLETSNVGNTYGGFVQEERSDYPSALKEGDVYEGLKDYFDRKNYVLSGDPYGLAPISPTEATLPGGNAFLSSNTITAFSILDTGKGVVESYYFDVENPESDVILFDSFSLR